MQDFQTGGSDSNHIVQLWSKDQGGGLLISFNRAPFQIPAAGHGLARDSQLVLSLRSTPHTYPAPL